MLLDELVDCIQELHKDGRRLSLRLGTAAVPLGKFVPERQPLFLDQDHEPFQGAIEGVHQQLSQRADLGGPIPAVRAVDQD